MCERCGLTIPEGNTVESFSARFAAMQARARAGVDAVFCDWLAEPPASPSAPLETLPLPPPPPARETE